MMNKSIMTRENELTEILNKEVVPALGCTGPTAISFATAAARELVGGKPISVKVMLDRGNMAKNDDVGIPGTELFGQDIAAALGAICGDASAGLENLHSVTPEAEKEARVFAKKNVELACDWNFDATGLYIDATVVTDRGTGRVIVAKTHTNIVYKEVNGEVIYQHEDVNRSHAVVEAHAPIREYGVADFYEYAKTVPFEKIAFLNDAIEMNVKLAEAGMAAKFNPDFSAEFNRLGENKMIAYAKALTSAASQARMMGLNMPAMSCATSGNVGITGSVPLYAAAVVNNKDREALIRALALSYLMTIYGKNHIGRLSAMCACAVAASIGVTAGTAFLLGGDLNIIEQAIKNTLSCVFGIVCDGARITCAYKLANTTGIAMESALFALNNEGVPTAQGVVGETADATIELMGRVAREGMIETDKVLCRALYERSHGINCK